MQPTSAFRTCWYFACERQEILFRRLQGLPQEQWTSDPILQANRFTNAYRVADRVSQYLLTRVLYQEEVHCRACQHVAHPGEACSAAASSDEFANYGCICTSGFTEDGLALSSRKPDSPEEVFFRTMLFKIFNKESTWEAITNSDLCYWEGGKWSLPRAVDLLSDLKERQPIYNNAYMMPSGGKGVKHWKHLELLYSMMAENVPGELAQCTRVSEAFQLIASYPLMGNFLAMQYVTDLNYSETFNWEDDFVVPGPGARAGIKKAFEEWPQDCWSEMDVIRYMHDTQNHWFKEFDLPFERLYNLPLSLMDCQNLFCEFGKYCRVAHPEFNSADGRTKIKQRYMQDKRTLKQPVVPPKWLRKQNHGR